MRCPCVHLSRVLTTAILRLMIKKRQKNNRQYLILKEKKRHKHNEFHDYREKAFETVVKKDFSGFLESLARSITVKLKC